MSTRNRTLFFSSWTLLCRSPSCSISPGNKNSNYSISILFDSGQGFCFDIQALDQVPGSSPLDIFYYTGLDLSSAIPPQPHVSPVPPSLLDKVQKESKLEMLLLWGSRSIVSHKFTTLFEFRTRCVTQGQLDSLTLWQRVVRLGGKTRLRKIWGPIDWRLLSSLHKSVRNTILFERKPVHANILSFLPVHIT